VSLARAGGGVNHIIQHIPGFVGGVEPKEAYFTTTAELLEIPWVKTHLENRNNGFMDFIFYRFSKSGDNLMVEKNDGNWWWVIGRLRYPELVDLPLWKFRKIEG
jgi:hypothetical protein